MSDDFLPARFYMGSLNHAPTEGWVDHEIRRRGGIRGTTVSTPHAPDDQAHRGPNRTFTSEELQVMTDLFMDGATIVELIELMNVGRAKIVELIESGQLVR